MTILAYDRLREVLTVELCGTVVEFSPVWPSSFDRMMDAGNPTKYFFRNIAPFCKQKKAA